MSKKVENKNPTVSVIIPTYNRAHLIGASIQSVLNQTYQDFELIVVDDGSTDNTEAVVKSFKDPRIHYIRHKENRGGSAARNTGIKSARGEYIAFLDSDDEWFPTKMEKQMEIFDNGPKDLGVVYCGTFYLDKQTNKITEFTNPHYRGNVFQKILKQGSGPSTPAAIVKRECFEKVGLFDERLPAYQETDLWIRISRFYQFDFVKEHLVKIMRNHRQISTDFKARLRGRELFLMKHSNILPRRSKSKLCYMIGNACCLSNEIRKGKKYFLKSIIIDPFYLKPYVCLLVAFLGASIYRKLKKLKNKKIGKRVSNVK